MTVEEQRDKWMAHANDLRIMVDHMATVIEKSIPHMLEHRGHQTNDRAYGVVGRLIDEMRFHAGQVRRMEKG